MDTLLSLQVFRLVAELKSFAAAAKRLDMSPAMASKHVKHLEQRLSTRLLNRTSRHVSLSEAGVRYLEQSSYALDALAEVEAEVSKTTIVPRGTLKLSAPEFLTNTAFVKLLSDYQKRYPEVQLDIDLGGRALNLVDEGFDLALRIKHAQPLPPGFIERPLAQICFHLIAAPNYLERHGRPTTSAALNGHQLLMHSHAPMSSTHTYKDSTGTHTIKFNPVLQSSDETLLYLAAVAGMGIAFLPKFMIKNDLASNRLELLLPEFAKFETTICGIYPSRKYLSAKVKTFLDFFAEHSPIS
ncbi:MAG TPA: LysR family transcriptional regulator [Spongiibacteraceae bacterium]|nr:LysR family transcriptional regulator [Spongiibacteraceae bacterium]